MVRVGNNTSTTLILNTGAPFSVPSCHDCMPRHDSNTIINFADDTTVVVLNNKETNYREEVKELAVWCQDSNFSHNVSKTK